MAINIGLSLTDHGYDEATNSNLVTVKVTASWSGGSYNKNAHTTIEINGVTETFKAYINGAQTNSGHTTIYDSTVAIDRSAASDVYVKVTVDAGGTTGTTSAEGILPLSDGPSGGGGGGGDDDEEEYSYVISATVGEGTFITVTDIYDVPLKVITESKDVFISRITSGAICIYASVLQPELYELSTFTCGSKTEPNKYGYYLVNGSTEYSQVRAKVVTEARLKSSVRIDNGESLEPHAVYIDNGEGWDLYAPFIDNGTGWEPCV